jgi:ABC-type Na+ efflux pump permease subunit
MNELMTVLYKEWKAFLGSERGMFIFYGILILSWSLVLATNENNGIQSGMLWIVFFSVIITANFSNTIFISERINGALEIFMTCGLSRNKILGGKLIFINVMTIAIGLLCAVGATVLKAFINPDYTKSLTFLKFSDFFLFGAVSIMSSAGAAYFSVRLPNPRFLHFVNLLIAGVFVSVYAGVTQFMSIPIFTLIAAYLLTGIVLLVLAVREYGSERILQPVIF